jgi:16S rRNA (guanine966-N2)-methyltransferase
VREAVASAIESRGGFEGARVLDLYAGTGALAFEALSRGAVRAVLVERDAKVARVIGRSAGELGLSERCEVIAADLHQASVLARIERAAAGACFDRVFVDPPYAEVARVAPLLEALRARGLLDPSAILAVEHASRHAPAGLEAYPVLSHPRYGDTAVLLLALPAP